jgi:type IV pilus assembly protein PilW
MFNHFVKPLAGQAPGVREWSPTQKMQQGSSLIELLVGLAVGLMVIAAAMSTLVLSRGASRGVNDQLELQQQANMAMRIMTATLRQANTRELLTDGIGNILFTIPPVYTLAPLPGLYLQGLPRDAQGNDNFGIAYSDVGGVAAVSSQDCLGNRNTPIAGLVAAGTPVNSQFAVNTNRLMCTGTSGGGAQPLIGDVQRFRVLYGVQTGTGIATTTNYFTQANVPNWNTANVVALELCLELATPPRGNEPAPGNYINCDDIAVANDSRTRVMVRQSVRLRAVPVS